MNLERAIALAAGAGESSAEAPVWIQIAKCGQWQGHPSGPFQLGPKEFGEIVSAFRSTENQQIPIDFEHVSEMDPREGSVPNLGAPAQGWIVGLDNRGQGGLWALVRWGDLARKYIREGAYKFFSPTIRFNSRDPKSGVRGGCRLSSGALTNQPFLDGMAPLTAKDVGGADEKDTDDMITPEQLAAEQAKVTALSNEKAVLAAEKGALATSEATLKLSLKEAEGKVTALETENADLKKFKADTEAKVVADRVALAFNTYKDAKNLTDDDKDAMVIVLTANPEKFEKLYPKVEPGKEHLLRKLSTGKDGDGTKSPRSTTVGEEKPDIKTLADKIQNEKKCDRDTAFDLAWKQLHV